MGYAWDLISFPLTLPLKGHLYGRFSEDANELLSSCRAAEAEYRAAALRAPGSDPAALDRWPLMLRPTVGPEYSLPLLNFSLDQGATGMDQWSTGMGLD